MTDSQMCFQSGIWWHRIEMPTRALEKRGHAVKQVAIGAEVPEALMEWPDVVIFGRSYAECFDPVKIMRDYKKRGTRVLYDMDDDFWEVAEHNPSSLVSNAHKDQYEGMIKEADVVITPSKNLAKKFKKHFKKQKVMICPNAIDTKEYKPRPKQMDRPVIGYMGAASHWKDLQLIGEVIEDLSKKYDFFFTIYGITGDALEAALYMYNKMYKMNLKPEQNEYFKAALEFRDQLKETKLLHIPFMPPELHPGVLSRSDFDIGIAPLEDTEFNKGKSCVKFYEYAGVDTVTLASDVEPYKSEVNYRAKNTKKDWYNKLEKLLVDKDFREKTLAEQQKYVLENRTVETVGVDWEVALQNQDGIKTRNQRK